MRPTVIINSNQSAGCLFQNCTAMFQMIKASDLTEVTRIKIKGIENLLIWSMDYLVSNWLTANKQGPFYISAFIQMKIFKQLMCLCVFVNTAYLIVGLVKAG